jgi:hypothetical protein
MEGMGAGMELREMNCVCRRDARRVVLARVRALHVPIGAAWSGGSDPHDQTPPENSVRRFLL